MVTGAHRDMVLQAIFFYLFATIAVASAFMVIASRNPVHSVLFLILAFFNAAGLFILLGAEFLAMLLVVVYVGAVMVLFLFVVMMLDVDFVEMRQGFLQYMPVGGLIGMILLVELLLVLGVWVISPEVIANTSAPAPMPEDGANVSALGQLIYTRYILYFQTAGLVLLVAMIGAIVLTLRHKDGVKRQDITTQVGRTRDASIEVRKVETGKGI
jgi:NADH-quinone oxidoreductase subunit J